MFEKKLVGFVVERARFGETGAFSKRIEGGGGLRTVNAVDRAACEEPPRERDLVRAAR